MPRCISMTAPMYNELRDYLLPHVGKDEMRPMLTGVRVRTKANGEFALDTTDSFTGIRAVGVITHGGLGPDDPLPDDLTSEPQDFIIPGKEFLSIRPDKSATVHLSTVREADEQHPYPHAEVTDGTTTVVLRVIEGEYPNLDQIVAGRRAVETPPPLVGLNGKGQLRKFTKLTVPLEVFHLGGTSNAPMAFHFEALLSYHGILMPVRINAIGDEGEAAYAREHSWREWPEAA